MLRNDSASTVVLDGVWDFRLGADLEWAAIAVPGCWEAQGFSKWLDGPAEYRRQFAVPSDWAGSRVLLEFDAVSYAVTASVNGREVGKHLGMWTPFTLDITDSVHFGGENVLEMVVYKPGTHYPMRSTLAGFLPDVATTFGGIWQGVRIRGLHAAIEDLRLRADGASGVLHVSGVTVGATGAQHLRIDVTIAHAGEQVAAASCEPDGTGSFDLPVAVLHPLYWSTQQPALYDVAITLSIDGRPAATAYERTGFRQLTAEGDRLLLNGAPICVRGVLHWGWDPQTIAPAFRDTAIRDELRLIRSLGFNMVKLCLFVPTCRFYEIADEEGVLLWQEWPLWLPEMTPELQEIMPAEYTAYMQLSAHHPSVVLYSVGCELPDNVEGGLLAQLDAIVRGAAAGALVCDNSGSSEAYGGAELDLADFYDYHTYTDLHFFEPMLDHWRRDWRPPKPWIFGEFNDTDGFRDLHAIITANGGSKPWWMTEDVPVHTWRPEVRALLQEAELLERADLGFSAQELVEISRRQSRTVIKFVLEAVRRRAGMGGYVVIGIRDTPIATSGILDDLGRSKWPPADFNPFNDDAVLCLETNRRRRWSAGGDHPDRSDLHNWWSGSEAVFEIVLNNAGAPLDPTAQLHWHLADASDTLFTGGQAALPPDPMPGAPYRVARLMLRLPQVQRGTALRLRAWITDPSRSIRNEWPIWVFPHPQPWPQQVAFYDPTFALVEWGSAFEATRAAWEMPHDRKPRLVIATAIDGRLFEYLTGGGTVLLLQQHDGPLPTRRLPFWRESIKLLYEHPVWEHFPHKGFADLQFYGMATDVALDSERLRVSLPRISSIRPILKRLDAREFHVSHHLVELEVAQGRMLVSTLRHQAGAGAQPVGLDRNVGGYALLDALVNYLLG